jgi:cytochrome c oxidase subunit 2
VQKGWSIFFGVVLLAIFLHTALAPLSGWWLPKNVSSFGGDVDLLFYVILGFTGFFFVLTEAILVYTMYRYAYDPNGRAAYVEGNHKLEIAWTIVPALILLFIAFAQVKAWEYIKYQSRMPPPDQVLQVTAKQWEWRLRYPEAINITEEAARRQWAETPQFDDYHLVNEVHTWKGANVKLYLKTQDVIHSLYLPNLRLKQDALPGKTIPVWFNVTESNTKFNDQKPETSYCDSPTGEDKFEIACAELCGGSHYRMRGMLYVHPDKTDYEKWLAHVQKLQRSREPEPRSGAQLTRNDTN